MGGINVKIGPYISEKFIRSVGGIVAIEGGKIRVFTNYLAGSVNIILPSSYAPYRLFI